MGAAIRAVLAAGLVALLAGCLPGGGAPGARAPAGPNPVTGGEIEVTELAPVPAAPAGPRGAGEAAPAAPLAAAAGGDTPRPKPRPAAQTPEEAAEGPSAPDPAAPTPAEALPEAAKSEAQLACERRRGVWADAGNGLNACVQTTRDAGKTCRKAGDCEGECLARSGTCAPFTPLFGCNDIFDDAGRRMTLCLD